MAQIELTYCFTLLMTGGILSISELYHLHLTSSKRWCLGQRSVFCLVFSLVTINLCSPRIWNLFLLKLPCKNFKGGNSVMCHYHFHLQYANSPRLSEILPDWISRSPVQVPVSPQIGKCLKYMFSHLFWPILGGMFLDIWHSFVEEWVEI